MPDNLSEFDDLDLLVSLDGADDALGSHSFADTASSADSFIRIRQVLLRGRTANRQPIYRLGQRSLSDADARRQLVQTQGGIFLAGASRRQAHQYAQRIARDYGGTVSPEERHGTGRPHFHVEAPGLRTGHIFYGKAPKGTFFDEAY